MTAFAAVVCRGDAPPAPADVARVAHALAAMHQTPPRIVTSEHCALVTAPVRADQPDGFAIDHQSSVTCVGQVLLENPESIARELALPLNASPQTLIVHAYLHWGAGCAERVSGEYAFVVWDSRRRVLVAARDGLGLRPLYVAEETGAIVLSNMLTATLADPAVGEALDEQALVEFLATGGMSGGRTVYRNITALAPGHTLVIEAGRGRSLSRHWWFPQSTDNHPTDPRELVAAYRHVLERAVSDRVRHEARTSILLSGGLDSTTIAAAARAATPTQLRAFTAAYDCLPGGGEVALASAAGDRLGIQVTPVPADREDVLYALGNDDITPQPMDEPLLSGWRALIRAAGTHGAGALYGADGDALFAPPGLQGLWRQRGAAACFADVMRYLIRRRRLPYVGLRVRERIGLVARQLPDTTPAWFTDAARVVFARRGTPSILNLRPTPLPPHPTRPGTQTLLDAGVSEYLSSILSPEVTRTAVELRCPLLDSRVLRFVMATPPIPWCQQKHLPRRAFRGRLPDEILDRPKTGLAGVDDALTGRWQRHRDRHAEVLHPGLHPWVDRQAWQAALDSASSSRVAEGWRVFELGVWLTRRHELMATTDSVCTR